MRQLAPVLVVIAVLAAVIAFRLNSHDVSAVPYTTLERRGDTAVEVVPPEAMTPVTAPPVSPSRTSATPDPAPELAAGELATDVPGEGRSRVIGRVVDQDGEPLADALVQLLGYQAWAAELDVPELTSFAGRPLSKPVTGFETHSDAMGTFVLDVPAPTGDRSAIYIAAGRFHDSLRLTLGGDRAIARPPLAEGLRDLGDIRLAVSGAIFGRVTDARGQPLAGVKIGTGSGRSDTYGRDVVTQADGSYVLGHARVGTYVVKAKFEGFISGLRDPVTVEEGQDAGPIDFVLEDAPRIEGRIVDERNAPVADARLWGWPKSHGSGAGARSDEDGRFVIFLPQVEPYTLQAEHPDFATWGDANDRETWFRGGEAALAITMVRAVKARFLVVDDETGEPIEAFGFEILEDNGSQSKRHTYTERRRPRVQEHVGGMVELAARTGIDLYVVHVDGYLLASGDVAPGKEADEGPEVSGHPTQVVRMRRGVKATGRVVRGGEPVPDTSVEIVSGYLSGGTFQPEDNTILRVKTGPSGRFAIDGLKRSAQYRLTVRPTEGSVVIVSDLRFSEPGSADLGDIELVAGGTIEGTVRLPSNLDPGGLLIYLGAPRDNITRVTDAAGAFRFDGVAPGEYSLSQDGRPGEIESGGSTPVTVVSGEISTVVLDATSQALIDIEITVLLGDLPVDGVQVRLHADVEPDMASFMSPRMNQIDLGKTDASGVARGKGRAMGAARIEAVLPGAGGVIHETVRLQLDYGTLLSATVEFELAELVVAFPASVQLPEKGMLWIDLGEEVQKPFVHHRVRQRIKVPIEGGVFSTEANRYVDLVGSDLVVRGAGPGEWTVTVYAIADGAEFVRVDLGGGGSRSGPERSFEFSSSTVLVAGQRSTVVLQ